MTKTNQVKIFLKTGVDDKFRKKLGIKKLNNKLTNQLMAENWWLKIVQNGYVLKIPAY